jgi:hypothetical protein
MSFDPHAPRFGPRRPSPAIESDGEEPSGGPDASPFSRDGESTDDLIRRIVAEALEQMAPERCCVCPLCWAIVASDGSVLG